MPGFRVGMGVRGAQRVRVAPPKATLPCWRRPPRHPSWGHSDLPVCVRTSVCLCIYLFIRASVTSLCGHAYKHATRVVDVHMAAHVYMSVHMFALNR